MASHNNRNRIVIATKYTTDYLGYALGKDKATNHISNHRHSLHMSDHLTSIEEVIDSLHILVQQGKVLYLGISDSPAWVVSAANYYGVLGRNKYQTKKEIKKFNTRNKTLRTMHNNSKQSNIDTRMLEALAQVAGEHNIDSLQAVALGYVRAKAPGVIPLVGGRKIEYLKSNIQALDINLTQQQFELLEGVQEFKPGFPNALIGPGHITSIMRRAVNLTLDKPDHQYA
ncbi:hypothetical protein N7456_008291 [Penicillium angulare]|uniref:NADP-dependent oxidoreductase domain-containing protein n=1 Tax=Penicillium angulare TaxID=116970 RepID=A0A9W9FCI3_9EURO|nr:hypothetical protein N7456_008291 [Penicillium angulare]